MTQSLPIPAVRPTPALSPHLLRALLAAVMALGLLLRLWHLGTACLWNDELFSRFYIDTGLRYLWGTGFRIETTPPTYYTLLLGWTRLFGTSEAALRLPSVLVSTLTIPLVYRLGRELAGQIPGLLAALIFAVAPMELYYAQEARAYAFMLPPVTLMLLCGAILLRTPAPPPARRRAALAGYILSAALAIYVHNTAVLIVAAAGLTGAGVLLAQSGLRASWRALLVWAAANAAIVALCLPVLLAIAAQVHANRLSWMLPTHAWDVRNALANLVAGPAAAPLALQTALALALAAVLGLGLFVLRLTDRRILALLVAAPALDFAIIVASSLRQPILVPRLLCWMWVPLSVLLAIVLAAPTRLRPVFATVAALVLSIGLGFQLSQNATAKEPWRLLLTRIAPALTKADLVVTGPWTDPMALQYYGADMRHVAQWTEHQPATIENTTIRLLIGVPDITRATLESNIRAGHRVVLIQRSVESRSLALLAVPPPARIVTQHCWAMGDCLAAMEWNP